MKLCTLLYRRAGATQLAASMNSIHFFMHELLDLMHENLGKHKLGY